MSLPRVLIIPFLPSFFPFFLPSFGAWCMRDETCGWALMRWTNRYLPARVVPQSNSAFLQRPLRAENALILEIRPAARSRDSAATVDTPEEPSRHSLFVHT